MLKKTINGAHIRKAFSCMVKQINTTAMESKKQYRMQEPMRCGTVLGPNRTRSTEMFVSSWPLW